MSLRKYRAKRDLRESREPNAIFKKEKLGSLRFVVQKHDARHLHYDLRLEFRGVLLSWAIPKGPSLNPVDKRLAIHVENHPIDYQYFEGVIPEGHYGAGTVKIWDSGTYTTVEGGSVEEMEKYLSQGIRKGHFSVIFDGEKLQGEFNFVKLKQTENEWLLIKKEDAFATSEPIIESKKKV